MLSTIKKEKIIAILRNIPSDKVVDLVKAISLQGINVLEVSLMDEESFCQIEKIKKHFGSKMTIGAGTVLSVESAKKAMDIGSDFLFAPSSDRQVLDYCAKNSIKFIPGVFTPSDVSLCLSYGYKLLKLFPANVFPLNYIKSLKGPFPTTEYIAVGGVNGDNYNDFLSSGFVGVGIGSSLFPKELIAKGDWHAISKNIARYQI